jgi:enamine deaminase RidA (YjgF/YER057c/UK114 family)
MARRVHVNPPDWPAPPGYSHAVVTGGGRLVVVSGQVPVDASGALVGGADFAAQARQAFENLGTVLAAAGADFGDVVKLTYFVVGVSPERVVALRSLRDGHLGAGPRPASSLVGVAGLFRPDVLVEIEAIAELPTEAP